MITFLARKNACSAFVVPAIAICGVAIVLGAVWNLFSPRRIPWFEDWGNYVEAKAFKEGIAIVETDKAAEYFRKSEYTFIDARPPADYDRGHVPGALSVPERSFDEGFALIQGLLSPSQPVVVYCGSRECDEAFQVAARMKRLGYTNVLLYVAGMEGWQKAGLPVEGGSA